MIRMYVVFYRLSHGVKTMLWCSYSLQVGHLSRSHWLVAPVVSHGPPSSPSRLARLSILSAIGGRLEDGPAVQLAFGN